MTQDLIFFYVVQAVTIAALVWNACDNYEQGRYWMMRANASVVFAMLLLAGQLAHIYTQLAQ